MRESLSHTGPQNGRPKFPHGASRAYILSRAIGVGLTKTEPTAARLLLEAKESTAVARANVDVAHAEIAARLAIAFRRDALAEPWPSSLEPISESGGSPSYIT